MINQNLPQRIKETRQQANSLKKQIASLKEDLKKLTEQLEYLETLSVNQKSIFDEEGV